MSGTGWPLAGRSGTSSGFGCDAGLDPGVVLLGLDVGDSDDTTDVDGKSCELDVVGDGGVLVSRRPLAFDFDEEIATAVTTAAATMTTAATTPPTSKAELRRRCGGGGGP